MSGFRYLLATELDRTLLPNGQVEESPAARQQFNRLAQRPEVTLVYVSARHQERLQAAMLGYQLPQPAFVVGDLGSTIWRITGEDWQPCVDWETAIAPDWGDVGTPRLQALFADVPFLRLQEPHRQGRCKISYYAPSDTDVEPLLALLQQRLERIGVAARLLWSQDAAAGTGLLDLVPRQATKLRALEFLIAHGGFEPRRCVFCGNSRNDMELVTSALQTTLVANTAPEMQAAALAAVERLGLRDTLYLARGGWRGMNGNYAAGIVEGFVHFLPETGDWLDEAIPD